MKMLACGAYAHIQPSYPREISVVVSWRGSLVDSLGSSADLLLVISWACLSPGHDWCGCGTGGCGFRVPPQRLSPSGLWSLVKAGLMMSVSLRKLLVIHYWTLKSLNFRVMSTRNDLICLVSHSPDLGHPGSESRLSPSPTPALGSLSTAHLDSLRFSCSPAHALTLHISASLLFPSVLPFLWILAEMHWPCQSQVCRVTSS